MNILTILFLLLSGVISSYAQMDPSEEGSTTRAIESTECDQITAKAANGQNIRLERCEYGFGGINYNPERPNYAYYQDGKPYDGYVRKNQDGTYSTQQGQDFRSVSDSSLPDEFKCDGKNGNELQCLVCNCYYESRGQNYQEKMMVGRVVLSRVMNPIFENSVCGVVHERRGERDVAQFSWIRRSEDNCLADSCNSEDLNDPGYKVNSLLGNKIGHKTELDRQAYGECIVASKEALTKRNDYFASYYYTGAKPGWARQCEENYKSSSNRISANRSYNGSNDRFSHNFYGVCEERERELSKILTSPRPRQRPQNLPTRRTNPATS